MKKLVLSLSLVLAFSSATVAFAENSNWYRPYLCAVRIEEFKG